MIGQTIANFRIVEQVRLDETQEVYRAEDTRHGREVLLKFLPTGLTPEALQRFGIDL